MRAINGIFAILTAFFCANTASAYLVGTFGENLDPNLETHVFVVGFEHEMGDQFILSALATARRLKESFPERQYLFLVERDKNVPAEITDFQDYGLHMSTANTAHLDGSTVIELTKNLKQIASLEFFSHAHAKYGSALAGSALDQRFYQDTDGLETLRGRFTRYGYVYIHGCNAGLYTAGEMSRVLQLPVIANLTGSNFQQLFQDLHWYFNDEGLFPAGGAWLKQNPISYLQPRSCGGGYCHRLVADNHNYHGTYGNFSVGLGFAKTFCNYDYGTECFGAMATSLLGFPSEKPITLQSGIDDYEPVVREFLCPSADKKGEAKAACYAGITDHLRSRNMVFSVFRGREPSCDIKGCKISVDCDESKNCKVESTVADDPKDNMMKEYIHYLKGYEVLFQKRLSGDGLH